jgi:hypothetical protein
MPLGSSNFYLIRRDNNLYVDKTRFIPLLEEKGPVVFLARPRVFGKTLLVSTMEAYFLGRKKYFQGLAAEEYLNSPSFKPRPVISLCMGGLDTSLPAVLERALIHELKKSAYGYNLNLDWKAGGSLDLLSQLICELNKIGHDNGVVLLIDGYDSPINHLLDDHKNFEIISDLTVFVIS